MRFRSVDAVMAEVEGLIRDYAVRGLFILDESFTIRRERAIELALRLKLTGLAWGVQTRVDQVNSFYTTTDSALARDFLRRYNVRYIIVGQLERAAYAGYGIEKFEWFDGRLWQEVYRDGQTVIYEVIP